MILSTLQLIFHYWTCKKTKRGKLTTNLKKTKHNKTNLVIKSAHTHTHPWVSFENAIFPEASLLLVMLISLHILLSFYSTYTSSCLSFLHLNTNFEARINMEKKKAGYKIIYRGIPLGSVWPGGDDYLLRNLWGDNESSGENCWSLS